MSATVDLENETEHGSTVVISHRVQNLFQPQYEDWLREIGPICRGSPGNVDWQVIRPIPGLSGTYTIISRFDSRQHLEQWVFSETRKQLIRKAQRFLELEDRFFIRSGLDFWFAPDKANRLVPVMWKQFLVTWSAIFPIALVIQLAILPVFHRVGLPQERILDTFVATASMVALMVFLVMPRYTKLVKRWLFK
jgi:antibiotic biosynthesis monooxygenase (ABM) superfamily enzyme